MLLSVKEAAEILGMNPGVLTIMAKKRLIGFYQFGENSTPRKFSKKHIQDFLLSYEKKPIKIENIKDIPEIEKLSDNEHENLSDNDKNELNIENI